MSDELTHKENFLLPAFAPALRDISLDQLDRHSFAKKVAHALAKRRNQGSVVIGLYGAPGEGKTTVLNFLGRELAKFPHITYLRFNPSQFTSSGQLLKAFYELLSDTLNYSDEVPSSIRRKLIRLLEGYLSFIAPDPDKKSGSSRRFSKSPQIIKTKIDALFSRLDQRFVFLIDDLDKTELSEVKTFFRLMKLSANFPNSVYVLSFNDIVLSAELGGSYQKKNLEAGKKILSKVVNLQLHIPPAGKEKLLEMCFKGIAGTLDDAGIVPDQFRMEEFKEVFKNALSPGIKTPRHCSFYLDTLASSVPGQGRELDTFEFMLVEALRVFYPGLFNTIRNNPEVFIGVEPGNLPESKNGQAAKLNIINASLGKLPGKEKEAVKTLLAYLFPCLPGLQVAATKRFNIQNPWIEEKPAASKQYFSRYFLLKTSGADDFQREVDRLLLRSTTGNINELALDVRKLARQAGMDAFIQALKSRFEGLSPVASGNLVRAFSQTGGSFSNPDTLFSFETVYSHPAVVIRKLLLKIPDMRDRYSIASYIMKESEPVSFAFECLRWIRQENSPEKIFSFEIENELNAILAERIKSLAYNYPIYLSMPQEAPLLLSVWSFLGGSKETASYLESTFRKEPENVVEFLKCYMPDEWLEDESYELNGNFLMNLDSAVSRLISPEVVYNQLEKVKTDIRAISSQAVSLRRRLLQELSGYSGDDQNNSDLKVFRINDYGKVNAQKSAQEKPPAEEIKKGSLAQVSKGLYRPLYDLF